MNYQIMWYLLKFRYPSSGAHRPRIYALICCREFLAVKCNVDGPFTFDGLAGLADKQYIRGSISWFHEIVNVSPQST